MDLAGAYEVLGLSSAATAEQVTSAYRRLARKYHPDVQGSGDSQKFILLSAAYAVILTAASKRETPLKASDVPVPAEVLAATGINTQLEDRFSQIEKDYCEFRDRLMSSTETFLSLQISSAASGSKLKHLVEHSVGDTWNEMVRQLEEYVRSLIQAAAARDREFLQLLFHDLYRARRQYWLHSMYHNPLIVGGMLGTLLLSVAAHVPTVGALNPWLAAIKDMPWLPYLPLGGSALYGAVKLWSLNPKNQFVPPRLSTAGVHAEVRELAAGIGQSLGESTAGGAAAGVILGAYAAHPLLGLAVGGLIGLFTGENLPDMKKRVTEDLKERLEFGVQQLNERILGWVHRRKLELHAQTVESFSGNFSRVTQSLVENKRMAKRLAVSAKLLLEGPAAER